MKHSRPRWHYALAILVSLVAVVLALHVGRAYEDAVVGRLSGPGMDVAEEPAAGKAGVPAESLQVEGPVSQMQVTDAEDDEAASGDELSRQAAENPAVRTVEETVSEIAEEYEVLEPGVDYEPETIVVSVASASSPESLETSLEASGIVGMRDVTVEMVTDDVATIRLEAGASVPQCIAALEVSGLVAASEPNYYLTLFDEVDEPSVGKDEPAGAGEAEPSSDEGEPAAALAVDEEAPVEEPSDQDEDDSMAELTDVTVEPTSSDASQDVEDAPEQDALLEPLALSDLINDTLTLSESSHAWHLLSINADKAWQAGARGDRDASGRGKVGIAVLDAGFDLSHEDLAGNFVGAYNAVGTGQAGTADNMHADNEHGNHVAGVLGAVANNGIGVAGVSHNASVVPVCVSADGRLVEYADLVRAYAYVIDNADTYNIRVINLSIGAACKSLDGDAGSYEPNEVLSEKRKQSSRILLGYVDKAYEQGIVSVMASGNRLEGTGGDGSVTTTEVPYEAFPSDYGTAVSVIALKNTKASDPKAIARASYSNYNRVDDAGVALERDKNISAPGSGIYSTNGSGGYGYKGSTMSGTSMASPMVAGTLGLVFAANQDLGSTDVALTQRDVSAADHAKSILYATARDLGDEGWDPYYGYGEVDAAAAVAAVTSGVLDGPAYLKVGETASYEVSSRLDGWSASSSDEGVLAVDASGSAQAIAAGTADVMARVSDDVGKSHTALLCVNVFGPMSGASELPVDCTTQLSIAGPSGFSWTWGSSDAGVATVSGGLVTGKAPGTATITATLDVDERVSFSWEVTVTDEPAARTVEMPVGATFTYDGEVHQGLTEGAHLVISCTEGQANEATDVGAYEVTATPEEGYTWSDGTADAREVSWTIKPATLVATYAGGRTIEGVMPTGDEAQVTVEGFVAGESAATAAGYVAPAVDFGDVYAAVGTYDIAPSGGTAGNYRFSYVAGKLVVMQKLSAKITESYTYNATEQQVEGVGCTFSASGPQQTTKAKDAGTYTATATLEDGYQWPDGSSDKTRTITWTIEPASVKDAYVEVDKQYSYTGEACEPKPFVMVDGVELVEGVDYTLRYEDNLYAGTAKVYVDGRGNYEDTATLSFEIGAPDLKHAMVTGVSDTIYTGSAIRPRPTVVLDGRVLVEGVDYTLSYRDNVDAGTATVIVTATSRKDGEGNYLGKEYGNYLGECEATFRIFAVGGLETYTVVNDGAPKVSAANLADVAGAVLDAAERAAAEKGARVEVWLEISALGEADVDTQSKRLLLDAADGLGAKAGAWVDISLYKQVGGFDPVAIEESPVPVRFTLEIPEALRQGDGGATRTFYLIRVHDGETTVIGQGSGTTLEADSNLFSPHLLAYEDTAAGGSDAARKGASPSGKPSVPATGDPAQGVGFVGLLGLILVLCGIPMAKQNKYPQNAVRQEKP